MRKLISVLAIVAVAAWAIAQPTPTSPYPVTVTYFSGDPTTTSCTKGQTWVNTTTRHIWACDIATVPPSWIDLTAASAAGFPITETDGTNTTTLDSDLSTPIAFFQMLNATQAAGFNFGTGVNAGSSLFASDPTTVASSSLNLATQELLHTIAAGGFTTSVSLTPNDFLGAVISNTGPVTSSSVQVRESGVSFFAQNNTTGANAGVFAIQDGRATVTVDDATGGGSPVSTTTSFRGFQLPFNATVASASTITPRGSVTHVTGTTTITNITVNGGLQGLTLMLIFDAALTVQDGGNLRLEGDFVTTADDTLTLVTDGTNWYEISRRVN